MFTGSVVPLDRANVDTDAIIPKQFLKSIKRTGFGDNLFDEWRSKPDFVLNQPQFQGATVLLTRANFGCGSSREHAVWALLDYGFRAIIAPSFAEIFYSNCFKNGILPVTLDDAFVNTLFKEVELAPGYELTVDLERQCISTPAGEVIVFDVDPFRKDCLLNGLDDISLTLHHADEIRAYEKRRRQEAPWLFQKE